MNFSFDAWECPRCGFMISDVELQHVRFDFGCPRCKMSFGQFTERPAKIESTVELDEVLETTPC